MEKILFIASIILLSACSSSYTAQDKEEDKERYALYDAKGMRISQHRSFNDCNAASIRYNIRKINNTKGIDKTYQRTPTHISKETVTCRKEV